MHMFDRANDALRHDLEAYHRALRTIVTALPQAQALCERVLKEARLVDALLAFFQGPLAGDIAQISFHLTNLWPYRERPFARTVGFTEEMAEAKRQREEALRAIRLLLRAGNDPVCKELTTCFEKIIQYLDDEHQLLAECHVLIQPHAANMDTTRKRLALLNAMVDARLPSSAEQRSMLAAYQQAAILLQDWEQGVPLEERGVAILEGCLDALDRIDGAVAQTARLVFEQLEPAH